MVDSIVNDFRGWAFAIGLLRQDHHGKTNTWSESLDRSDAICRTTLSS